MNQYKEWIQSESTKIWINQVTKQEICFHPMAIEIGNHIYKAHERLIKNLSNVKKKGNRK